MTEQSPKETPIRDEFEALGKTIQEALNAVWDSDQRKNIQTKVESGLREIGDALDNLVTDIQTSEKGQRLREDVEDMGERIRSGEVADKAREGLLNTLQKLNAELMKATTPKNSDEEVDSSEEA